MVDEWSGGQVSGASQDTGMLDMDALFQKAIDQDEVRQAREDLLKPVGSYVTVPVLNKQVNRVEEGPNQGRLMIRYFGPAVLTVTDKNAARVRMPSGSQVKAQFGFAISPERANKLKDGVDTGEPDHPYKLWLQAVSAYEQAYKRKPSTIGEVAGYLENYAIVIRVIQVGVATERNPEPDGEPGNIVMGISAVREER